MKNLAVLILFVLSLAGVAVTVDATTSAVQVQGAFELPGPELDAEAQALENKRRKKRDGGRGEEDEEELRTAPHPEVRVADALRVLDAELNLARFRGL
jgi:hypothetical protein